MHVSDAAGRSAPDYAALTVVILGVTAFAVAQGLTYPLISLYLGSHGVSSSVIGLNAATFSAGLAAATLSITRLTAVMRGDRLIIAGLIGCAFCLAAFAVFDSLLVWFAARFLLGFCASLIFMLSEAWLGTAAPNRLRGRIAGVYGGSMSAGFAVGPLAIPLFGTQDAFAFGLMAVGIALVAFLTVVLGHRTRTQPARAPAGGLLRVVRRSPMLVCLVMVFGFADIAAISGMPVYFVRIGYSDAFAAFSVTTMALPTALAQPLVGVLLDKVPRRLVALGCGTVAGAAFLTIPWLHSELAILIVFAILGAASFALYTCALTLLGDDYSGGLLVAGTAAFALAYAVGSAAGSTITGFAMDVAPPAAGPISVGVLLIGFSASLLLAMRARRF